MGHGWSTTWYLAGVRPWGIPPQLATWAFLGVVFGCALVTVMQTTSWTVLKPTTNKNLETKEPGIEREIRDLPSMCKLPGFFSIIECTGFQEPLGKPRQRITTRRRPMADHSGARYTVLALKMRSEPVANFTNRRCSRCQSTIFDFTKHNHSCQVIPDQIWLA